jgi:hypothetical protein
MITCAQGAGTIGLLLNLGGVWLLFAFGLPKGLALGGLQPVTANATLESIRKAKVHKYLGLLGFALIVAGTTVQIIALYI